MAGTAGLTPARPVALRDRGAVRAERDTAAAIGRGKHCFKRLQALHNPHRRRNAAGTRVCRRAWGVCAPSCASGDQGACTS
ncbi:hypothetical protein XAP412_1310047 [Xanthomonas phaseoli pv. phaseoli]|uniref:Uncharacterized protein n=1 Tax=Xanthomonas campestris pv. phaseoli TaxID=317013 RepID=A0AB38DW80_XANCH|nr:hypothetical protein XAP412_1310047 [Xanthomonas phaseoli pv. phaseoli]SON82989.1 hypothetical protein XAP7430_1310053 [Xanthomonas phaseoli pv. phaseoli]SOO31583.1 hypothetical protein XAP6164_5680002 [Xanthomonas phaseoli pv. phaseoli]